LRALLVEVDPHPTGPPLHDVVARVASRLARDAPHLAWLCIAASRSGADGPPRPVVRPPAAATTGRGSGWRQLILATWSGDRRPPRVAALVIDPDAVVDSDAETLAALAASAGLDATTTHARWLDLLGRESLTRRFYRALDRAVDDLATTLTVPAGSRRPLPEARRALALLYASRMLFLAFLEAKGWLDGDRGFLMRVYAQCVGAAGGFHHRVLRPLFFGTLNTPVSRRAPAAIRFGRIPFLNGGLFCPTPLEQRLRRVVFSDAALGAFVGDLLGHYRFTAREDQSTWSEAAIDPEMLGKSFEALMAPDTRRTTGAYYTPQSLVAQITEDALSHALASPEAPSAVIAALLRGECVEPTAHDPVRRRLRTLRVLDPACGSGAFLVHALDVLAALAGRVGDHRPPSERRRNVLARSIFGVDINPTAVWLCELRLWLSVVIENKETDPGAIVPLPNLDRNVRVGDALAGGAFGDPGRGAARGRETPSAARMARLRERYSRAVGLRKREALRALDQAERNRALITLERELARVTRERLDAVTLARGRDLFGAPTGREGASTTRVELRRRARSLRARIAAVRDGAALPFAFAAHFGDVEDAGGFDLVLGNPPWVRPHAVPVVDRERLRRDFAVCRDGLWARGATIARAGRGFGAQVDVAALFVERSLTVARPGGVVALLLPAKLWRCLAGGGVRRLVSEQSTILGIEDWSDARASFDAAVYPSLVLLQRLERPTPAAAVVDAEDGRAHRDPRC
jgi:SAM-dependent methyltransferase